jgi:hypothetical protein
MSENVRNTLSDTANLFSDVRPSLRSTMYHPLPHRNATKVSVNSFKTGAMALVLTMGFEFVQERFDSASIRYIDRRKIG